MESHIIKDALLEKLKTFDSLDLLDPIIVVGVNSIASVTLTILLTPNTGFNGDVYFDYDPDPYLKVGWWHQMTGSGDELIFRFNPLRVEDTEEDYIAAYKRAMSVI